ncbi:hypothetical protein ES708_24398 [subsurface metagenome]
MAEAKREIPLQVKTTNVAPLTGERSKENGKILILYLRREVKCKRRKVY